MNIRKSTSSDFSKIKSLWQEVFGDSEEYITRFINHFGIENCYVCETNGEMAAMAFAIPATLSKFILNSQNRRLKPTANKSQISNLISNISNLISKYIYACATKQQYRKKGIMKNLLEFIHNNACNNENVEALFLRAANENLANYYRKLGFDDFFYRNEIIFNRKERKEIAKGAKNLIPHTSNLIPHTAYHKKRLQKLEKNCFVNWNEDFFRFINDDKIQFCECENSIFSFRLENDIIIVDELLGELPESEIADFLFEMYPDVKKIEFYLPGNDLCCGQLKQCNPLNENIGNGYFAFAME